MKKLPLCTARCSGVLPSMSFALICFFDSFCNKKFTAAIFPARIAKCRGRLPFLSDAVLQPGFTLINVFRIATALVERLSDAK
uniref:Secreted protein n=1 Tax=Meloidogyne incognita TaxID=6306 RepID=A0A914KJF9_MELIC